MGLDLDVVGQAFGPETTSWTSTDAILYSLGVGAGRSDLAFTTENTNGFPQRVLPTAGVVLGEPVAGTLRRIGDFDLAKLLHVAHELELHAPIPVEATASNTSTITAMYDKGSAAVVVLETTTSDGDGTRLFTNRSTLMIRGVGGWGGDRGPSVDRVATADRNPDHTVTYRTSADQALLYRLSGDRNPLHSDPSFARRAGFDTPILHGLCTYGFTGRALVDTLGKGDPDRARRISGRFTATVCPGAELTVDVWEGDEARFTTRRDDDTVVLEGAAVFS